MASDAMRLLPAGLEGSVGAKPLNMAPANEMEYASSSPAMPRFSRLKVEAANLPRSAASCKVQVIGRIEKLQQGIISPNQQDLGATPPMYRYSLEHADRTEEIVLAKACKFFMLCTIKPICFFLNKISLQDHIV